MWSTLSMHADIKTHENIQIRMKTIPKILANKDAEMKLSRLSKILFKH